MIDRRKFLTAMLSACAAPMIVRASSLMKVRALPVDDFEFQAGDVLIKGTERLAYFYFDPSARWSSIGYKTGDIVEFNGAGYLVGASYPRGT